MLALVQERIIAGRSWKDGDLNMFIELQVPVLLQVLMSNEYLQIGLTKALLLQTMQFILAHESRWFQYVSAGSLARQLWRFMEGTLKEKGLIMFATCLAAKLLVGLGVGVLVRTLTVPGGGNPNWWFVARPVKDWPDELANALGFHASSTPSLAVITERMSAEVEKPLRAPDINWSTQHSNQQDMEAILTYLDFVWDPPTPEAAAGPSARTPPTLDASDFETGEPSTSRRLLPQYSSDESGPGEVDANFG